VRVVECKIEDPSICNIKKETVYHDTCCDPRGPAMANPSTNKNASA